MPQGQYKLSDIEQPKGQYNIADIEQPAAVPDKPQVAENPGIATRFTQSLLDNTVGTHTNEGVIEGFTKGIPRIAAHPLDSAGMILDSEAAARQHQLEEAAQLYQEPGIANKIGGFAHHLYGSIPFLGPALGGAADQFQKGDIAGGLGSSVGIAAMTHGGSPEVQESIRAGVNAPIEAATKFVKAESNPNKLYASYLGPVADNPHPVPNAPAPVLKAVLRDMEAAGDGEAATRIKSGQATIGDLDTARQSANRLAKSIYRSPGNYPPGMATGADNFAASIRDGIYPEIEQAHGMDPGSLRNVKDLQGQLMQSERNPGLINKAITQGIGGGAGSYVGYKLGGTSGAIVGAGTGVKIATPIATAVDRGIIGLRTKGVAMNLPEPQAPTSKLPFLSQQPTSEPVAQSVSVPTNSPSNKLDFLQQVHQPPQSSVTGLGPKGEAGTLVRLKGLLPAPTETAPTPPPSPQNLIDILNGSAAAKQLPGGGVIMQPTPAQKLLPGPRPEANSANTPALPIDESVPSFLRGKSNATKTPYLQAGQDVPAHMNRQQLAAIDKAGLAVGENGKLVKKSVVEENALFNILRGTASGSR